MELNFNQLLSQLASYYARKLPHTKDHLTTFLANYVNINSSEYFQDNLIIYQSKIVNIFTNKNNFRPVI